MKKFEDFVQSPYFNKKTNVTKLYRQIKNYSPEFKSENLKREIVWKDLYPGKQFNYGVMKNLIYDLTQLAERILAEELIDTDKYELGKNLLLNLGMRDLSKQVLSKYKSMEEKLINAEEGSDKYEKLSELKWTHYSSFDNMDRSNIEDIYEIANYTIYHFLINIFKIYNNVTAQKLALKNADENNLLEKFIAGTDLDLIIEFIRKNLKNGYKTINIYYDMYKAIKNTNNPESYYQYKKNVLENDHLFENIERRNLFACLCTALTYNETIKYKSTEFNELNKIMHFKKIITDEDGFISIRDYSFGVRMAAMVKDVEFLKEFVQTYFKALRPSTVENMNLYGMAYLHYARGEFTSALELINKINFDLTSFKFELKNLQLILFYELNDFNSLLYALDSYRHHASNNRFVSEAARKKIFRFINYLNSLFKLSENPDKMKIELLKKDILNDTLITKYWLLEKTEEPEVKK